jgi:peptidoglycan/LPS O-acetylase OafA/YrhL
MKAQELFRGINKISFQRLTSSGRFIPEIDGLRFIAISSVVLFHLNGFLCKKLPEIEGEGLSVYNNIATHGHLGVPLFFAISGFILGLPFALAFAENGKPVNIRNYFVRRLTRLEPPYILTMAALFISVAFFLKTMPPELAIKSYLASFFYIHNIVFPGVLPRLNAVAWSLEIEVQFYILAPVIARLFLIKNHSFRRAILIGSIVLITAINEFHIIRLPFRSLINYLHYFFMGFLLVDYYLKSNKQLKPSKLLYIAGIFVFCFLWLFDEDDFGNNVQRFFWRISWISGASWFYHLVLINKLYRFLSLKWVTNIGGMCYSIYLLHYPLISFWGGMLVKAHPFNTYLFNYLASSILLILVVLFCCSIFYLLVERPCMNKDWHIRSFAFLKSKWYRYKLYFGGKQSQVRA